MIATAPKVSAPQHLEALARANAVRLARAELKRNLAEGAVQAADVFVDCPWEAASMNVADVLLSQRRWGSHRCRKFLFGLRISETKTVGALTERQRREVAARLGGPAPPRRGAAGCPPGSPGPPPTAAGASGAPRGVGPGAPRSRPEARVLRRDLD